MHFIEAALVRVHSLGALAFSLLVCAVAAALTLDAELPVRLSRGDRGALKELFDRHAGQVFALAQRILKDRSEAEDVVQETFIEVWRRAQQYDASRGQLSTWMFVIARSRAIDRVRRRRPSESTAAEQADWIADPFQEVQSKQAARQVMSALAELPGEQRDVIDLAFFEGLTQQEIAGRTGIPLGTVKTRMRLAMDKLARSITGAEGAR
jgi:RNA polymerase sigma-70 factor (ECF subfamily)